MSPNPNIPVTPIHSAGNTITNQSGQELELMVQDQRFSRDLLSILKPGVVYHGRVVEQFSNGSYLFNIRGRNMIASSQLPLMRDSVVPFEVLQTKDGIHIRLVQQGNIDSAQTSNMQHRLSSLQLPNTADSQMVLRHFEQQAAPLDTNRLQQALQAVQQAPTGQGAAIAAGHALLAKHQLPVTPALLLFAQSAISPNPNASQALPQLLQQLQTSLQNTPLQTGATNPQQQTAATGNPLPSQVSSPTAQTPTAPPAPPSNNTVSNQATAGQVSTSAPTSPIQSATAANAATHAGNVSAAQPAAQGLQQAFQTLTQIFQQDPGNQQQMRNLLQLNGIQESAARPINEQAASTNPTAQSNAVNFEQQGALKSLINELAQITQQTQQHEPVQQQNDALKQIVRDISADTIFKPQHLHDYDAVLPLLMNNHGMAQQARIAIAKRPIPGQHEEATFLRVDVELQQLGPLSLRMSSGNGPIVITVFATGQGLQALQRGQEDLLSDLQDKHIEAHIRIADLLEHEEALHG